MKIFKKVILVGLFALLTTKTYADKKPRLEDNFYKNVNYEWIKKRKIPDSLPYIGSFLEVKFGKVEFELKKIVTRKNPKSQSEQQLKNLYTSYLDIKTRDKIGLTPIAPYLKKIDSVKSYNDLALLMATFIKDNIDIPIEFGSNADFKDASMNVLTLSQSGVFLSKELYITNTKRAIWQRKMYKKALFDFFKTLNLNNSKKRADNVIEIETLLVRKQFNPVQNRDLKKLYNPYDYKKLSLLLNNFPLKRFVSKANIDTSGKIIVAHVDYLKDFNNIYRKVSLDKWKDYIRSKLFVAYANILTKKVELISSNYYKDIGLQKSEALPWRKGLKFIQNTIPMLLGRVYVENYFDESSKDMIISIVNSIKSEYKIAMQKTDIFTSKTKKRALEKLDKITFKIGYPDKWEDFSSLNFKADDLFGNFIKISRYKYKKNISKINKKVDRSLWDDGDAPYKVNASYDPLKNSFILLAGVLNRPFFDKKASLAENYGGIGAIIAHEIGHAFDDQGKLFDKEGNLKNWWAQKDEATFRKISKKLVLQANSYKPSPDRFMNGQLKLGEIIGDLNGVNISFTAYSKIAKKIDLSKDRYKKFFLQFAYCFRQKYRDEFLATVIANDPHPTGEYRTNYTLKNMDSFYEVFSIKPSDKMYLKPKDRVKIW